MTSGEHQGIPYWLTHLSVLLFSSTARGWLLVATNVWVKATLVWAMEIQCSLLPCPNHNLLLVMGHCMPLGMQTRENTILVV